MGENHGVPCPRCTHPMCRLERPESHTDLCTVCVIVITTLHPPAPPS